MMPLGEWTTFCEVLGSAAGALTGLQFVLVALLADLPMHDGEGEASDAFATPTVVHFASALFLAATLSAPWHSVGAPAALWGIAGGVGLVYTGIVMRRMHRQSAYKPVLEDWVFHATLPAIVYATFLVSACVAMAHPRGSIFAVAFAGVLILLIGVHNAWDNVTFILLRRRSHAAKRKDGRA